MKAKAKVNPTPKPEVRSFPLNDVRRNAIASAVRSKFSAQIELARGERDRTLQKISLEFAKAGCPPEIFAIFENPALRHHLKIRRVYAEGAFLYVPEQAWDETPGGACAPYLKAAVAAEAKYEAAREPVNEAVSALVEVLKSCSTSKKAIEQLPELRSLIEAQAPYQAQTSGGLVVYGAADAAISKLVALGMKLPA